ncbi:MAG: phosphotransferase family protein, partial [Mycobacterium sp.]
MIDRLPEVLAPVLGEPVVVEKLTALTGGASRSTWAFQANGRRLILRTGPPDDVHVPMAIEAKTQQLAAAQGAPVPHVLVADETFLICDFIDGETIAPRILRKLDDTARPRLLEQCAQALAAIHRVDPAQADLRPRDQMALWRAQLDEMGDTTATIEWTLRWLDANPPAPSPTVMVHGDYRMGNL